MKTILALTLAILAPSAIADNYATCLLDKLPGLQNRPAVYAALRICGDEHPGGFREVPHGSGLGFFASYKSEAECMFDKGGETHEIQAARLIQQACDRLYGKPNYFDQFDNAPNFFDQFDAQPQPAR